MAVRIRRVFQDELAPYPGRFGLTMRYVVASALVICISMALEVPCLGLGLIAVFFATQENFPLTKMMTALGLLGLTISIGVAILLIRFTIDFPMVRILGACLLAFCSIYLLQVSNPFRLAGFLTAMSTLFIQSLVDTTPNGEVLLRLLLWVLLAGWYPANVALVITYLFPCSHSPNQLKRELGRGMDEVIEHLEARRAGEPSKLNPCAVERGVNSRQRLLDFAGMQDKSYVADRGQHLARITTVERLQLAAAHLSCREPEAQFKGQAEQLDRLIGACRALKEDLMRDRPFRLDPDLAAGLSSVGGQDAALREMADALTALADAGSAPIPSDPPAREGLFRPDAFRNPAYAKVALRTILAAMICYTFYTMVDWPGIHTAMLTCVILSMPPLGAASLGGISHKSLVRVIGAALGSGIALFQTVFILPHLDGITGLLAMVLPVMALCGWLATGSSKSHYIGRQLMFTYALALLNRFALTPDITEIRDRSVGILAGIVVYLTLATVLWPVREGESLQSALVRAVRSLAGLVRVGREPVSLPPGLRQLDRSRANCWTFLRQSRDLEVRVALQPGPTGAPALDKLDLHDGFAQVQETLCAVDWLQVQARQLDPDAQSGLERELAAFRESAARSLEQIADQLEVGSGDGLRRMAESMPRLDALEAAYAQADPKAGHLTAAARALRERIVQLGAHLLPDAPQPAEES